MRNASEPLRLFLFRHGETTATGKLIGHTDVALSARGHAQAAAVAEQFAAIAFTAIYASDLRRARQTAEPLAQRHGVAVQTAAVWREVNMGEWEGHTLAELYAASPEQVTQCFTDPEHFIYPGGEALADFAARIQRALTQLLQAHAHGQIALFTHGGVCRAILATALALPMSHWLRLAQDYGSCNIIEWRDGLPTVLCVNQTADRFS
jgi:alpha-ribazole phosphatase